MPKISPSRESNSRYKKQKAQACSTDPMLTIRIDNKEKELCAQVNNLVMRCTHYHFNYMHCIVFYRNMSMRGSCKMRKRRDQVVCNKI